MTALQCVAAHGRVTASEADSGSTANKQVSRKITPCHDRQILARAAPKAPSQVFSQCVPLSARRADSDMPKRAKAS